MRIYLPTLLFLLSSISQTTSVHLSLPSPRPIPPSLRSRHTLYIDQKIQVYANTIPTIPLNHNLYHQRNVNPLPLPISNISLNHELYSKRNAIASSSPTVPTPQAGAQGNATMNVNTEKFCTSALAASHSSVSNPSGIAACYNVLTFHNATGVFGAEIRLYRIAKPSGAWVEVVTVGEGVDVRVVYEGARTLSVGMTGEGGSDGDVGKRDGGGREVEGEVVVPVVGREEARDLWRRRNAVVPVYVGGVEIEGRVDRGVNMVGVDLDTIRSLLTPTITLSSTTPHGTTLTITLSTNTTSFLTGLFAFPNSTTKSFEASVLAVAGFREEYVLPGTSMVCFPTSLVVTCIWTVVCLSVQGRGMWREWRAREEYRWRVRRRRRCGENRSWYGV